VLAYVVMNVRAGLRATRTRLHFSIALLTAAASTFAASAHADPGPPRKALTSERLDDGNELGIGVSVSAGKGGEVGSLGVGWDLWYRPHPWLAGGIEAQGMFFDNLEYCSACLRNIGVFALGFIEAHPAPRAPISLFARFGLGLASLDYASTYNQASQSQIRPVAMLSIGPQVTVWHLFLRARGTATFTVKSFIGWGLELGTVIDP
jgi:hypothetical protein